MKLYIRTHTHTHTYIYIYIGGRPLESVDKFIYLEGNISSTESVVNICLPKAIDRLSIIWKSDQSGKIKRDFYLAVAMSILVYGCTIWTLTKCIEKRLYENYTRMLRASLTKSQKQHPIKQRLLTTKKNI